MDWVAYFLSLLENTFPIMCVYNKYSVTYNTFTSIHEIYLTFIYYNHGIKK